jgi:tetratricopeptide (TPR) repeat protein
MLLPVAGLFAVGFMFYAPVADHWAYAALVAVVVVVVAPVARRIGRQDRRWRIVGGVAGALLALMLAAGSFERSRLYHDQETLFRSVLVCNPGSWTAHTILGTIAFNRGELDLAETHFEAALSSKPGYWEALHGLGVVYATRGEAGRAIPLFEEVLRQRPDHAYAAANLARARRAAGRAP